MSPRKLGRGLESLLHGTRNRAQEPASDTPAEPPTRRSGTPTDGTGAESRGSRLEALEDEIARGAEILEIPPDRVEPNPYQPRRRFDRAELEGLKASIAREGLLQPIVVRRHEGAFQLVAGERRLRASQDLGLERIPARVAEVGDDRLLELALIENLHREDLNPVDTALAFQRLIEMKGWTQDALAQALGLGRPTVSNTLRLLELPDNVQRALGRGQIQMGHAKVLLSISDSVAQQQLFEKIAEERLSVRDLELSREALDRRAAKDKGRAEKPRRRPSRPRDKSANIIGLESELSEALGTRVTIQQKKGKGVVRIEFYSSEDFQSIRRLLLAARKGS